jgi:hypothetical protein
LFGSLPSLLIASLMHARSTTAGTPVKSYHLRKVRRLSHQSTSLNDNMIIFQEVELYSHQLQLDKKLGVVWFPKCNINGNGNGLHLITIGNKFK